MDGPLAVLGLLRRGMRDWAASWHAYRLVAKANSGSGANWEGFTCLFLLLALAFLSPVIETHLASDRQRPRQINDGVFEGLSYELGRLPRLADFLRRSLRLRPRLLIAYSLYWGQMNFCLL